MHHFLTKFLFLFVIEALLANCCIVQERQALLTFKAGVNDPSNRLDSWTGNKCCDWAGITCSNRTGQVVKLDLHNPYTNIHGPKYTNHLLSGNVSSSLQALSDLQYLDLSYNNFSAVPEFIGLLGNLKYLNMSNAHLFGKIPPQLGNLSQLQFLDLSDNYGLSRCADIRWLSHLTSLRHLDMSSVDLQNSTEWVEPLNKLPLLEVLVLDDNLLTHIPRALPLLNFTSLRVLVLSYQNFNSIIPTWISSLHGLTDLNIAYSQFVGPFPSALGNLTSVSKLILDYNQFYGKIPPLHNLTKLTYLSLASIPLGDHINIIEISSSFTHGTWRRLQVLILRNTSLTGNLTGWVGEMSNLKYLDLRYNYLNGSIPDDIGNLINLVQLDLSFNSFIGSLTDVHLDRLSNLEVLKLGYNSIKIAIKTNWQPSFLLHSLSLDLIQVGPVFPTWLQNQVEIERLSLSGTRIEDVLPDWFWSLASLSEIDLTNNTIRGMLPRSVENLTQLNYLYLDDNHLEGSIPSSFPDSLYIISLSNNKFEQLPATIEAPNLLYTSPGNNSISVSIGSSFCRTTELFILDLSSNNLSGHLPDCFPDNLEVIYLSNNKLSGTIPASWCTSGSLSVLQLSTNNLTGEFPPSLRSCKELTLLDLGENKFHGKLPEWVGENFASLQFLRLRSNLFSGSIPQKLTLLSHLQVLDLGNNYLSGHIPTQLDNLSAMVGLKRGMIDGYYQDFHQSLDVTIKGIDLMYHVDSRVYLTSMDLSNNNLTGVIPDTITALFRLINLNLSHNQLTGKIPVKIKEMKSLESLDLHMNSLSGSIPQSISALNFLEVLNLSYNNLSGSIPTGYQLQTLDNPSIYMGNPYLCGPPLETSCNSNMGHLPSNNNTEQASDRGKLWFYLFIEFGFVVGFLGLFLVLLFKRSWRYAYFRMVDNVVDRFYVLGALTLKRLKEQA